ncbi:MAG TPA: ABC transporter permease [Acidisarcina sp.]
MSVGPQISDSVRCWWQWLSKDAVYASRRLSRAPSFSLTIIACLALGIGLNTAIYTLIQKVVLQDLPVKNPTGLVLFDDDINQGVARGGEPAHWTSFSFSSFQFIRDHNTVFATICAFAKAPLHLQLRSKSNGSPVSSRGQLVSSEYFSVFDSKPILGRFFSADDDQVGSQPVAVISFDTWIKYFGKSASLSGTPIWLNDAPFQIIGVAPPGFYGERVDSPPDLWIPLHSQPAFSVGDNWIESPQTYWLNLLGRLNDGTSLSYAQAAVNVELHQYLALVDGEEKARDRQREVSNAYIHLVAGRRGISALRTLYKEPLYVLMCLVGMVLLIASANVSALLIARSESQRRENALRIALGATRSRLCSQILLEATILSLTGGTAGIALAFIVSSMLINSFASDGVFRATPDLPILTFTATIALFTALLSSVIPFARMLRQSDQISIVVNASFLIRSGPRVLRNSLVIFQVAMAVIATAGAGLVVHSFANLSLQDLGFNEDRVLIIKTDPHQAGYPTTELSALYRAITQRVGSLPSVRSVSLATYSPASGFSESVNIKVEGSRMTPGDEDRVFIDFVTPDHFETIGTPLLIGRDINWSDAQGSSPVAIVNQTFARHFFGNQLALGRRFTFGTLTPFTIVGIVKDAKYDAFAQPAPLMAFMAALQAPGKLSYVGDIEIATDNAPLSIVTAVRTAISDAADRLPIDKISTPAMELAWLFNRERLLAELTTMFAILGIVLACLGIYGLISYRAIERTREIAIRLSLGSTRTRILTMMMKDLATVLALGICLGIGVFVVLSRLFADRLYNVPALDPLSLGGALALLILSAMISAYIPSARACRAQPMEVLRAP